MTLRAGSYDASRPRKRGVIREDSYPAYVCIHEHKDFPEAKECARAALAVVRQRSGEDIPVTPLPQGWREYFREYHTGQ